MNSSTRRAEVSSLTGRGRDNTVRAYWATAWGRTYSMVTAKYLVRAAVTAPVIRRRVMPQAVGHGLHQDWFILGQAQLPSLGRGGVHGQSVIAVDPNSTHAIARGTRHDSVTTVLVRDRCTARNTEHNPSSGTVGTLFSFQCGSLPNNT